MLHEPIHTVVVSDGYDDYLDIFLTHNAPKLDSVCVVTTSTDKASQKCAGRHGVGLLVTDEGKAGGKFNKGLMVERAIQQLPGTGWHAHIDADIVLPGNFRHAIAPALYSRDAIYGCDRFNVVGWEAWQKLQARGFASRGFEHHHFLSYPTGSSPGARLIYGQHGWCPIGYFQLWHSSVEYADIYRTRSYPTSSATAAHDDVQFALRFDRKNRILIPEMWLAHLVTEDATYGKNWSGRKTARFCAPGAGNSAPARGGDPEFDTGSLKR